jgi:hypothetical protein
MMQPCPGLQSESFVQIGLPGWPMHEQRMFWKQKQQPPCDNDEKHPNPALQAPVWQPPPSHAWNWGLQLGAGHGGHP